ncbi:MAG TPA: hypothetical protein VGO58_08930 [Chitinophagaceae bacterium]|jgi:hypothetical protein|nr:hypothetical protein [Chitinophagaceae bacterium]
MTPILLKRKAFTLCFIILPAMLYAQISETQFPDRTRNILWHTPCGASRINGLAIGFQAARFGLGTLTIRGVNADLGMVAAFGTPYIVASSFFSKKKRERFLFVHPDSASTIIYGVSISYGGEAGVEMHGINIAGGITIASKLYGLSLTGIYSQSYEFRGVCIGGLNNNAIKGTGLQIGLFNSCKQLKGVQVGLWNKSGKRGLPFINWGT